MSECPSHVEGTQGQVRLFAWDLSYICCCRQWADHELFQAQGPRIFSVHSNQALGISGSSEHVQDPGSSIAANVGDQNSDEAGWRHRCLNHPAILLGLDKNWVSLEFLLGILALSNAARCGGCHEPWPGGPVWP